MDLQSAIHKRRSIRKFTDKVIDNSIIKQIIKAGTLAPTACNRQGWHFLIVKDKALMKAIKEKGGSPVILNAPVGIILLYNKFTINIDYPDNVESASACIQNMLLTATEMGLGTCWINHLPPKSVLYEMFNIPKRYDIIAYIALGYPAVSSKEVPRKYSSLDDIISYDGFKMNKEIEIRKMSRFSLYILTKLKIIYRKSPEVVQRLFSKIKKKSFFKIDHDR